MQKKIVPVLFITYKTQTRKDQHSYFELEFLLGCCRGFGAVAGVLIAALRDEVDWWGQAVDGQLVAVPQLVIALCESTCVSEGGGEAITFID